MYRDDTQEVLVVQDKFKVIDYWQSFSLPHCLGVLCFVNLRLHWQGNTQYAFIRAFFVCSHHSGSFLEGYPNMERILVWGERERGREGGREGERE